MVTQTDFDNGTVEDNATAAGTPPSGPPVTGTSNTVTVDESSAPGIAITKSASPTSVTAAGQSVTYTFTVGNTGNVTLLVGVDDIPKAPALGVTPLCQSLSSPTGTCSGPTTLLVPGQIAIFTGTYTVTQGDIDHGGIEDTAVAKGIPPSGPPVFDTSDPVTVDVVQSPSLSISKSANPTTRHRSRPERGLHVLGHQLRGRHAHGRRGHRRAGEPRWLGYCDVRRPDLARRYVLGPDDRRSCPARRPSSPAPTRLPRPT